MTWLERHFGQECSKKVEPQDQKHSGDEVMTPGLTGEYDLELREKAGMHQPPPAPEHMGLEGEYDPEGLAKRVAIAFDRDPQISEIESLEINQNGGTIIFKGFVPSSEVLQYMAAVAAKVDGTKAVDTSQVSIG
ncbi:MAG TPA: phospholipid-binding protein [Allocoleopsis sp.]